jgi:hypothetical protein
VRNDSGRKTVATIVSALMTCACPVGDEFRVVAESVLRLLADVPGVLLHPGYASPVPVEMLLRTWAHSASSSSPGPVAIAVSPAI